MYEQENNILLWEPNFAICLYLQFFFASGRIILL